MPGGPREEDEELWRPSLAENRPTYDPTNLRPDCLQVPTQQGTFSKWSANGPPRLQGGVLEGTLAGVFCPHEVVLELVCRAVFGATKPALQEEPRHSRKVLGQSLAERRKGAGPEPYPAKVI